MANLGYIWTAIFHITIVINNILATPLYTSQYFSNGNGRNIRHLPCVSLRSGDTGVCMFAFNCVKANGTHLGTCLDRFYFGSCCKIIDEPTDNYPHDNTIEDASSSSSLITTGKPFESNDIPDYTIKPKPERLPSSSTTKRSTTAVPPETTTQLTIGLSTFQTVQSSHSDNTVTKTTAANTQIYTTNSQKVSSTTESIVKRPTTVISSKPIFNSTIAIDRNPPATRFPPRNTSTTTTTPIPLTTVKKTTTKATTTQKSTTPRPISAVTKRPVTATSPKKPSTVTKTPHTTSKPSSISKPSVQTVATTHSPSTSVANSTKLSSSTSTTSITKKPTQSISSTNKLTTTPRTTTATRTSVTTSKPRPSSQPTKTSSVTPTKPTTRPASRPTVDLTHKPRPTTTSLKPTPKPKPTAKPTGKPTKPLKPIKPTQSTNVGTTTNKLSNVTQSNRITTESTSVITTLLTTNKPTTKPTTTTTTTTTTTSTTTTTTERPTTMTNEIYKSTVTPGFITWSSNSDDLITESSAASSTPSSTTTTTTHLPDIAVDTDWSPITSSDGWIMIQSPSTKKPENINESVTESKPIKFPTTTAELLTHESTTQRLTTLKPTVPTVVSSSSVGTSSIPVASTTTSSIMPTAQLNMSDYKQVCGRRIFPESRIVGGDRSAFGKWPWQISLRQWRTSAFLHKCGAALLNENWAITAAHCVENVPPSDLLLRMGEHDLANEDEPYGFQERRVQIVASHPQFDPRTFEYDLALLRFYEPLLPFQPNLLPICLPDDDEEYVNRTAYVTGWGRLYEDGPLPSVLQEVSVPVINNTLCESMYRNAGYIEHIPHIFICAGWRKGGFDSCEGDSGGPLVIQRPRDKRWILAGVISWGIGCAEPNQPGVYTRISEFREWINQILQF